MATMQKMLFCVAVLATLILFTQANSIFNKEVQDTNRAKRAARGGEGSSKHELLHLQFQQLLNYLLSIFRSRMAPSGSSLGMLNMLGKTSMGGRQPGRREPQPQAQPQAQAQAQRQVVVSVPSSAVCDPPCVSGSQCCLLQPGSSTPSCHAMLLSGSECGWNHYTQTNPSTTVPLHNSTCPCLTGMGCLSATKTTPGVCSFF